MLLALPLLLGGCQAFPAQDGSQSVGAKQVGAFERNSPEGRGLKFARNRCSDCHAVEPGQESPNQSAPTFERVANTPGLTRDTLTPWLHAVHNFPREMYFEVPAEHIDDLVAYMITLRSEDYEPPI